MKLFRNGILAFLLLAGSNARTDGTSLDSHPLSLTKIEVTQNPITAKTWNRIRLSWELNPIYHAYLDKFKIESTSPSEYEARWLKISDVVEFDDKVSGQKRDGVTGRGDIDAEFQILNSSVARDLEVVLNLTYQACSKNHCLLPQTIPVKFTVHTEPQIAKNIQLFDFNLGPSSLLLWFLIFAAGILTSLTPCVFPLIPITLTVLGARHEKHRLHNRFILSLSYVLGIASTYALLGVIAASTGALFGGFLGHPMVILGLVILFSLNALSSLDWIVFQTPHFITQRLHLHKTQGGYLGAFLAGLIAGVVASPCVGPVLAGVLTFVAQTQSLFLGFSLLFVFAFGLGQLFLWLGTFADLQKFMPKSGPWMDAVKYFFALSFLGIAIFYAQPWLSGENTWRLFGLAILVSFFNKEKVLHWLHLKKIKKVATLSKTLLVILAGALMVGHSPLQWQTISPNTAAMPSDINWIPYSDSEISKATAENTPVVIDIFADWCTACKELERLTFRDPKVLAYKNKIRFLKFDATKETEAFKVLRKAYSIVGLPNVIFIDKNGVWVKELTLNGFEEADKFSGRLEEILK